MFEIIKCYMRLRRMDKINRGFIRMGQILQNDEIIKNSEEALRLSAIAKKKIIFNRRKTKQYNLEYEAHGLK